MFRLFSTFLSQLFYSLEYFCFVPTPFLTVCKKGIFNEKQKCCKRYIKTMNKWLEKILFGTKGSNNIRQLNIILLKKLK